MRAYPGVLRISSRFAGANPRHTAHPTPATVPVHTTHYPPSLPPLSKLRKSSYAYCRFDKTIVCVQHVQIPSHT